RWDWSPHDHKDWISINPLLSRYHDWGWHDAGVKLQGEGARHVWENFDRRWEEARTLPDRIRLDKPFNTPYTEQDIRPFNPTSIVLRPGPAPPVSNPLVSTFSVQVLESRFEYKILNRERPGGTPWSGANPRGVYQIYRALTHAIASATNQLPPAERV